MLNLQDIVQRELRSDEQMIWSGTPGRGSDRSGTITFGTITFGAGAFGTNRRGERPPAFEFVDRVRNVHDLIRGTLNEDSRRR